MSSLFLWFSGIRLELTFESDRNIVEIQDAFTLSSLIYLLVRMNRFLITATTLLTARTDVGIRFVKLTSLPGDVWIVNQNPTMNAHVGIGKPWGNFPVFGVSLYCNPMSIRCHSAPDTAAIRCRSDFNPRRAPVSIRCRSDVDPLQSPQISLQQRRRSAK